MIFKKLKLLVFWNENVVINLCKFMHIYKLPYCTAISNVDSPLLFTAFTFAPYSINNSTQFTRSERNNFVLNHFKVSTIYLYALDNVAATKGVIPWPFPFAFAPFSSNILRMIASPVTRKGFSFIVLISSYKN